MQGAGRIKKQRNNLCSHSSHGLNRNILLFLTPGVIFHQSFTTYKYNYFLKQQKLSKNSSRRLFKMSILFNIYVDLK